MEGMEDKLGAILNNPQMMQQIMAMAQSLNVPQEPVKSDTAALNIPGSPEFDPALMQKIISFAGNMGVDRNQQTLLGALRPYLSSGRILKLEKAMRAAKLASAASTALNSGALSFLTGR